MTSRQSTSQDGVALVTVLMIVAAMSAVAVSLSAAVLSSTNRAKSLDASAQADWLVTAAEEFGRSAIGDMLRVTDGELVADMPGLNTPTPFDVEGGLITVTGRDASNCFNLNSLRSAISGEGSQEATTAVSPRAAFTALLELAEIEGPDPEALTASLADWMDRDQSPGLSGAEDSFYSGQGLNYRTSGQPLADVSELHAIRYYTPQVVEQMRPWVCAMPTALPQSININTVTERQAPLLALAFSGALSSEDARDIIFQRPPGGWQGVDDLLALPAIAEIAPELRRTDMLGTESSHIALRAAIDYHGTRRLFDIVYELDGAAPAKTIYRERKG